MNFSLPFRLLSFLIFCLGLSFPSFCQYTVKGLVLDSIHKKPIPYAMVFIEGSTKGTVTNDEGFFLIEDIPIPSSLVVNHISFQPQQFDIDGHTRDMRIFLKEKNLQLSEVVVTDKNLRQNNVKEFCRCFLGNDYWGKMAILENDTVLRFQHFKIPVEDTSINGRNPFNEFNIFYAFSEEPLIIDLPLLGYKLYVVLINFSVSSNGFQSMNSSLGYYYYQPYVEASASKNKTYEKNRHSVYYNSGQHFCRSLYAGTLPQNGYRLIEKRADAKEKEMGPTVDLEVYLSPTSDNQRMIVGLAGKVYHILYYHKSDGSPRDLTQRREAGLIKSSEIRLLRDTCLIRSDGSIPDNSIVFGGEISHKKAGASLPDDYVE
ncbi:MAG: carboxypeptidase-like regulatory domain-containing protein [Bacteroidales bacterium]|nr:carboxypeptidase-like regulatory domain-containing protein [Bacteroidales bacterium]MDD3431024.1 carboxypeptidase-like regulatory domain-containing protein [Bacteroidales bacterium]MDD4361400.1 carboxypeptidase-like regulatory domain-containing protein [Bacteroidales bacterium]